MPYSIFSIGSHPPTQIVSYVKIQMVLTPRLNPDKVSRLYDLGFAEPKRISFSSLMNLLIKSNRCFRQIPM